MTPPDLPLISRFLLQNGHLNDQVPSVDTFDLDDFEARMTQLQAAFPEAFLTHAYAVKVNPIRGVLSAAREAGMGAECASVPELKHAIKIGFQRGKIIYGSVCKTKVGIIKRLKCA